MLFLYFFLPPFGNGLKSPPNGNDGHHWAFSEAKMVFFFKAFLKLTLLFTLRQKTIDLCRGRHCVFVSIHFVKKEVQREWVWLLCFNLCKYHKHWPCEMYTMSDGGRLCDSWRYACVCVCVCVWGEGWSIGHLMAGLWFEKSTLQHGKNQPPPPPPPNPPQCESSKHGL